MARTDAEHRRDAAPLSAPAKPKPAAISPRSISAGRLTSVLGASKGGARGNGHAARSESRRDGRK